jgi:hypothetical protein
MCAFPKPCPSPSLYRHSFPICLSIAYNSVHFDFDGDSVSLCPCLSSPPPHLKGHSKVLTVDVHGAGAANSFAARSPEGKGRVLLVLDLQESVQHLKTTIGHNRNTSLSYQRFLGL